MAKPWAQVETSQQFKALSPQGKVQAKREYWETVVKAKTEFKSLKVPFQREAQKEFFGGLVERPEPTKKPSRTKDIAFRAMTGIGLEEFKDAAGAVPHALSAFAFDIPRAKARADIEAGEIGAKEAYEAIYPEQETLIGKATRFGLEAPATLLGGPGKIAGKVFQKAAPLATRGLLGRMARGALAGTAFEAATAKPTFEEYGRGLERGATAGATIPVAGKAASLVGKGVSKAGKFISETFGGVTKATRETINRLGAKRVFEPIKSQADYIGKVVVPRVSRKIQGDINKFSSNIQEMARTIYKVPEKAIKDIKGFGIKNIEKTAESYGGSTDGIFLKIQRGFESKKQIADEAYKKAIKSFKGASINSTPFYQSVQKGLRQKGWIDLQGNPTTRYRGGLDPVTDKLTDLYIDMQRATTIKGKKIAGQLISKNDFSTYRDALSGMLKEKPSDILIMNARNSLYNSAEKSGMTGLKAARNMERQVFQAQRKFLNRQGELKALGGEKSLDRFYKLSQQQIRGLKEIEKYTGISVIEDIRKVTAWRYVNDISRKLTDPKQLEGSLLRLGDPEKFVERVQYKKLIGKDLFDDIQAHFANRDFNVVTDVPGTGGGLYPSRAGLIRPAVSGAARKYYTDVKPAIEKAKEKISPIKSRLSEYYSKPLR